MQGSSFATFNHVFGSPNVKLFCEELTSFTGNGEEFTLAMALMNKRIGRYNWMIETNAAIRYVWQVQRESRFDC